MDEKNNSLSFLNLLEHMKSYLGLAGRMGRDIEERQKSLTELKEEEEGKNDKGPEPGPEER